MSLATIQEVVSGAVPERDAIRWEGRRLSHRALTARTRRFANGLLDQGLGEVVPREELRPWEAGQDFVGVYMRNCPEYLEALIGAAKARLVPFNINYRYGAGEVRQVLEGAPATKAIVYETIFADRIAEVRGDLPEDVVLIEVGGTADPILPGAVAFENLLERSSEGAPSTEPSPDDLYVVFTGGTTGRPKAVMWRQADAYVSALNGVAREPGDERPLRDVILGAVPTSGRTMLAAPPFMHGGGQWAALGSLLQGASVAIQGVVDRLDCDDIWRTIERERVTALLITGNAFAVPLLDQLRARTYDLDSLKYIITGAVAMTHDVKEGLLKELPAGITIVETLGASESGTQLRNVAQGTAATHKVFTPSHDTCVLDEERTAPLEPGAPEVGWLARTGRIPLGYLGDRERTLATFPTIDGIRYSVPGDRARLLPTGELEFLGRDSVTINTGGEKVYAEEVEAAVAESPEVYDVVVAGRPHPRWGHEVVALVSLRPGTALTADELQARVAAHLARYKVPKRIAFVDAIPRNAVGKPDYAWARQQAASLSEDSRGQEELPE